MGRSGAVGLNKATVRTGYDGGDVIGEMAGDSSVGLGSLVPAITVTGAVALLTFPNITGCITLPFILPFVFEDSASGGVPVSPSSSGIVGQ